MPSIIVDKAEPNVIFSDYPPGIDLEFRISAKNEFGFGEEAIGFYESDRKTSTGPPLNIQMQYMSPTDVLFTYDPPEITKRNGRVFYYTSRLNNKELSTFNVHHIRIEDYHLFDDEKFITFKVNLRK